MAFVIPVRNDAARLSRCLGTLAAAARRAAVTVECVVVDNGSVDDSAHVARRLGSQVLALSRGPVSALRNAGARMTTAPIVSFVDADHEIGEEWITAAADILAAPRVGAAGALYLPPPAGTWTQRFFGLLRGRTVGRGAVEWLGSGNLAVRREVFADVGGFDESLQTCEDVDLCQRIRRAGWSIVADDRLESVHMGDPATLGDLFRSERWRGRDNLRFSLRTRPTLRDLPSIVIPIADAAAIVIAGGALLTLPFAARPALRTGLISLGLIGALACLRAARIASAGRLRNPIDLSRALAIALAYDLGRACSLLWPARHRRETAAPSIAERAQS